MEKDSRAENDRTKHNTVRNIAARLFSQQLFYSENYEQNCESRFCSSFCRKENMKLRR
jgi:hypothetical protein